MSSIRATQRQMRKLQQQRHLYDIKLMVLNNPLFKNLSERDQKKLIKLVYKAEMMEVFMRDRQIMRVNDSFDDIVESVANMLNDALDQDDDEDFDGPDRRKDF
jgi:TRAP-type C4-dicarboxylate transport system substrate-binding protein